MLNDSMGALININNVPLSFKAQKIINNKKNIKIENLLNAGDDYGLIIISNRKFRKEIKSIAKKNKVKISCIGKIIRESGIHFDSSINMDNIKKFDHFS